MSEYQYYEFVALDHRLTDEQMGELRQWSTRAEITPTRFQNVYNYGDFGGSPETFMEEYFDAHVYVTNWGTYRLMLRLPRGLLDEEALGRYACHEDAFTCRATDEHVILNWTLNDESGGGWAEGEGWMARLVPLRAELERGDLRSLYLGWLLGVQIEYVDDDDREPPVPPGLLTLTGPQEALADFLGLDPALIGAAAQASGDAPKEEDETPHRRAWLESLDREEMLRMLERVLEGRERAVHAELRRRYRGARRAAAVPAGVNEQEQGRTIRELEELREGVREEELRRQRKEAEARQRKEAARRRRYLADMAERFPYHWDRVEEWAEERKAVPYDKAANRLVDLAEAYALAGRADEFRPILVHFEERHARKKALIRRLDERRARLRV